MISRIVALLLAIMLASVVGLYFGVQTDTSQLIALIIFAIYIVVSFIVTMTGSKFRNTVFYSTKNKVVESTSDKSQDLSVRIFIGLGIIVFRIVLAMAFSGLGPAFYILLKNSGSKEKRPKKFSNNISSDINISPNSPTHSRETTAQEARGNSSETSSQNPIPTPSYEASEEQEPGSDHSTVPPIIEQNFSAELQQSPYTQETGTIRFIRKTSGAKLLAFKISVDGKPVGNLPDKKTLNVQTEAGVHRVQVSGGGALAAAEMEVEVYPARDLSIAVSFNLVGAVKLTVI